MATLKRFEDLEIWRLAREICRDINEISRTSPLKHDHELRKQINRLSGSIMGNIAEGFERDGKNELKQFLAIAKGSCGETRSQLYRIFDREYIDKEMFEIISVKQLL